MLSGNSHQCGFSDIRYLKVEEMILRLKLSCTLAVDKQLYLRKIGVYSYLRGIFHAVYIAFSAQMYERLIRQPCLVCIEGIFLVLAVESYQSLVVLTVLTALVSRICTEIEHVPYMRCPDILSGEELLDHLLMIVCLILLGVIALLRIRGMPVQRLASVLAHSKRDIRELFVEVVHPRTVHGYVSAVPSEVMVVRDHIRNLDVRIVNITHGYHRDRGQSRVIHLMNHVI